MVRTKNPTILPKTRPPRSLRSPTTNTPSPSSPPTPKTAPPTTKPASSSRHASPSPPPPSDSTTRPVTRSARLLPSSTCSLTAVPCSSRLPIAKSRAVVKGKRTLPASDAPTGPPPKKARPTCLAADLPAHLRSLLPQFGLDPAFEESLLGLLGRDLLPGRLYPHSWYGQPALSLFKELIGIQGWGALLSSAFPVYPFEVYQFYATYVVSEDGKTLSATVHNKPITLTVATIGGSLGISNSGFGTYCKNHWPIIPGVPAEVISPFFDKSVSVPSALSISKLAAFHKLLHSVTIRTIVPRVHKRGECTILDQIVMYHLAQGLSLNLPQLILAHIADFCPVLGSELTPLPYGMWLSKVLADCGVVDAASPTVPFNDWMSNGVLGKMGLAIHQHQLVRKGADYSQPLVREACAGCLALDPEVQALSRGIQ